MKLLLLQQLLSDTLLEADETISVSLSAVCASANDGGNCLLPAR
jgi:hypothetical protein